MLSSQRKNKLFSQNKASPLAIEARFEEKLPPRKKPLNQTRKLLLSLFRTGNAFVKVTAKLNYEFSWAAQPGSRGEITTTHTNALTMATHGPHAHTTKHPHTENKYRWPYAKISTPTATPMHLHTCTVYTFFFGPSPCVRFAFKAFTPLLCLRFFHFFALGFFFCFCKISLFQTATKHRKNARNTITFKSCSYAKTK